MRGILSRLWRLLAPPNEPEQTSAVKLRLFRYLNPHLPSDPAVEPDGYTVNMEVPLRTIAAIFAAHGWQLARPGSGPQPSASDIAALLAEMILSLDGVEMDSAFYQLARFVAVRSEEFPDDIDLYIHVGTATREGQRVGLDEPEDDDDTGLV